MIKAVFFDLYHTLVRYEPPREVLQAKALEELGIDVEPEVFRRPLAVADEFIYQEISRLPLSKRSEENKKTLWVQYERRLLTEAGITPEDKLVTALLGKMHQTKMNLVLFDDVIPALTDLKSKGLILGLISNVERDITPLMNELGLLSLLPVVVTSQDSGFNKPQPEIFLKALEQAGVMASEAIYVGDQYQVDVVGANRAGMKGILLDRGNYLGKSTGSPRIQSLAQVAEHLE